MHEAIDEILGRAGGKKIVTRSQERGASNLQRFSYGGVMGATAAWVHGGKATAIQLYDSALAFRDIRDPYRGKRGYLVISELLLHECLHSIDEWSAPPEFAQTVGLDHVAGRWRIEAKTPEDVTAMTEYEQSRERVERNGDPLKRWILNRKSALRMRPVRLPTIRAMENPAEAFAEIGAHLILDDRAPSYLPRKVVDYFNRNVFERMGGGR